MIVWRDRDTGPVQPSIRSAPSTGRSGMFLSVTTFMVSSSALMAVSLSQNRGISPPHCGRAREGARCGQGYSREEPQMSDMTQDPNFLQGIKVVDFTQFEAGTTCTEVLAWVGAEGVKIEKPGRGDPGRPLRPGKPHDDPRDFYPFQVHKKTIPIKFKIAQRTANLQE